MARQVEDQSHEESEPWSTSKPLAKLGKGLLKLSVGVPKFRKVKDPNAKVGVFLALNEGFYGCLFLDPWMCISIKYKPLEGGSRPRSIIMWIDLQVEFLKKFFPTHRTNGLKRQISNFSAKENEKFYECWESYFYDGMSSSMKQLLETMCGGDFMSKNLEEAMDFLSYVSEVSRGWDEPNTRDCPTIPAVREMFGDQANVVDQFKPNNNALYGSTYNSNWRNHPNFSWKPRPPQYTPPAQAPQQASNLNKPL
ncbi:hypothetical protein CK203_099048 [Vitis vinifera]|uniref:Retrotransposon gag domain-containing protein n=1 Tax=Vitis vinifera TaxID=29760 RepID=A0A438C604_VITVI|nr:hypothetical protein CK203_099048 [Vitis vinifera]